MVLWFDPFVFMYRVESSLARLLSCFGVYKITEEVVCKEKPETSWCINLQFSQRLLTLIVGKGPPPPRFLVLAPLSDSERLL